MILPTAYQNAREAAQAGVAASAAIARFDGAGNSQGMAFGHTRARACNSIFRYPSPCGCSESVPSGAPAFFPESRVLRRHRQIVAKSAGAREIHFSCGLKQAICNPEADKSRKGSPSWKISNSQSCVGQWRWASRPVATRSVSRRSSVPALARPRPLCWTATLLQAPLLAPRAMSSIANKTPASADTLISRGAPARPNRNHKAIVSRAGVGGFFVSKRPRIASGQDQEGT